MNPTDAEIAEIIRKLNGMKCGGAGITNQVLGFLSIYLLNRPMDHVTLGPKDLLSFCRAVVSKVDGEASTEIPRINTSEDVGHGYQAPYATMPIINKGEPT